MVPVNCRIVPLNLARNALQPLGALASRKGRLWNLVWAGIAASRSGRLPSNFERAFDLDARKKWLSDTFGYNLRYGYPRGMFEGFAQGPRADMMAAMNEGIDSAAEGLQAPSEKDRI